MKATLRGVYAYADMDMYDDTKDRTLVPYWGSRKAIKVDFVDRHQEHLVRNIAVTATSGYPMRVDRRWTGSFPPLKSVELFLCPGDSLAVVTVTWQSLDEEEHLDVRLFVLEAFDRKRNLAVFKLEDCYECVGEKAFRHCQKWLKGINPRVRATVKHEIKRALRVARYWKKCN